MTGRRVLRRVAARVVAAVAELLVLAEDLVLQPAPGFGARYRVEEDPEHDPGQEKRAVAALVSLASLDPVGCGPEVVARGAPLGLSGSPPPVTPRLPISSS